MTELSWVLPLSAEVVGVIGSRLYGRFTSTARRSFGLMLSSTCTWCMISKPLHLETLP